MGDPTEQYRSHFGYCQHDDQTEYTPDGSWQEGFYAYCPACGHKWHVTHEQWQRAIQPRLPRHREPDPDEIKF